MELVWDTPLTVHNPLSRFARWRKQFQYRGAHHLGRAAAVTVAQIKARQPMYYMWRGQVRIPNNWTPTPSFVMLAPPSGVANFPTLDLPAVSQ